MSRGRLQTSRALHRYFTLKRRYFPKHRKLLSQFQARTISFVDVGAERIQLDMLSLGARRRSFEPRQLRSEVRARGMSVITVVEKAVGAHRARNTASSKTNVQASLFKDWASVALMSIADISRSRDIGCRVN